MMIDLAQRIPTQRAATVVQRLIRTIAVGC